MPIYFADRVRETTTTTGTGTISLAGAVTGYQTFVAAIGNGKKCYYAIIHQSAAEWEVGIGTITDGIGTSNDTLSRETILDSSSGTTAVNFSSGTKDVICTAGGDACHDMAERIDVDMYFGEAISARDWIFVGPDGMAYKGEADVYEKGVVAWSVGYATEASGAGLGWVFGGIAGSAKLNHIDRIAFATDIRSAYIATAPSGKNAGAGISASNKGYSAGGISGISDATTNVDRLLFSNETASTVANLSTARLLSYGVSDLSNGIGYVMGGATSTGSDHPIATIEKITYSTDTVSSHTASLGTAKQAGASLSGTSTYQIGVAIGGSIKTNPEANPTDTCEKITYSTGAVSALSNTLNTTRVSMYMANDPASDRGYVAGGFTTELGAPGNSAERFTYSNETFTAVTTANMSVSRGRGNYGSISSYGSKGYFAGGLTSPGVVDRIQFSTETTNALTTASLAVGRGETTGLSNTENTPGDGKVSVRITGVVSGFSGKTAGAVQWLGNAAGETTESAPTNQIRTGIAVSSSQVLVNNTGKQDINYINGEKGWFAGGATIDGAYMNTADNLTFSTDTTAAQTSANLSQARMSLAACSDGSAKGYFAGGLTGAEVTTADRLVFSTGVTSAQASANLSQARQGVTGLSQRLTKGYFAGGWTGAVVATTDKITFANETTAAQTTANLNPARYGTGGISEGTTKGYFGGGATSAGSAVLNTDKILFANDTTNAQGSADLDLDRFNQGSCSDGLLKGYHAGGWTTSSSFTAGIENVTFSNDTSNTVGSATLSQLKGSLAGCSQGSIKGYFAGGRTDTIGGVVATADKLTFANETAAAQASANLTQVKYGLAGMSDVAL